jgi:hypothetical protein
VRGLHRLLILSLQGLHPDAHCNKVVEERADGVEPAVGWWREGSEKRRAQILVRNAMADEPEHRQRRSYSDIRPGDNYPFRRLECAELQGAVPHIDEKFLARKHVYVHTATK